MNRKPLPAPEEAPFCNAEVTRNEQGVSVLRMKFESFEALETFFVEKLIGSDMMKNSVTKVIGTTLLIWDRN